MEKAKVLIVEDLGNLVELWKAMLGDEVQIVWGKTLAEGKKMFEENPDIELIVMDCCVESGEPDSMELVREIRATGFQKPIIAKSGDPEYPKALLAVGASHSATTRPPDKVPLLILELLGLDKG